MYPFDGILGYVRSSARGYLEIIALQWVFCCTYSQPARYSQGKCQERTAIIFVVQDRVQ